MRKNEFSVIWIRLHSAGVQEKQHHGCWDSQSFSTVQASRPACIYLRWSLSTSYTVLEEEERDEDREEESKGEGFIECLSAVGNCGSLHTSIQTTFSKHNRAGRLKRAQKHSAALWWLDREHHVLVWGAGRFIAGLCTFLWAFLDSRCPTVSFITVLPWHKQQECARKDLL